MSRGFLIALGGGLLGAILFLTVRTASPAAVLFAFLSPLPLFAVGLWQGWMSALIAGVVASVAVGVAAGGYAVLMFALRSVVPVLIVVRQALLSRPGTQAGALEWYPPGLLLGWLTLYGLAMLGGASLWYMTQEGGLEGLTRSYFEAAFSAVLAQPLDPRVRGLLDTIPRYLPGTMVAVWLLLAVVNGVLAQALLARAGQARRPSPPYAAIELPRWMPLLLAAGLALSFLPGQLGALGRNAAVVMTLPYLLLGLAVVHVVSRRLAGRGFFMGLFYALVGLLVWPALFVVILGIIEQWLLLRRRFAPPGTGPEDA